MSHPPHAPDATPRRRLPDTVACLLLVLVAIVGAGPTAAANPVEVTEARRREALAEFQRRLATCDPSQVACRLGLARWARLHGLTYEAIDLLHDILERHPLDATAYELLVEMQDEHPLRTDSAALAATRDLLPKSFAPFESRRFIVLSDADAGWTQQQAELLERSFHQFQRFARRHALRPKPLRHKLVCVLFQRQSDYQAFAQDHDGVTADWMDGYYSPRFDRVVFFNVSSTEARRAPGRAANPGTVENRLCALRCALCGGASAPSFAQRTAHGAQPARADGALGAQGGAATTVHEAVHQLMFHTRVQSPRVQYPLWICEGLATAFETDRPNQAFGPDMETAQRRRQFAAILDGGDLMPLRDLVQLTAIPDAGGEVVHTVYNQSYALVTWLARFKRGELRRYLNAMRVEPAGRPTPERHLEIFESAFGAVERVENAWLRYERAL